MTQREVLDILKTGVNIFLTGEPGSGKTHTLNTYIKYLREKKVEIAVTASTGIAATHLGGVTIHSWSGIGVRDLLTSYDLDRIAARETVARRVRGARVLVIDEVSMLPAGVLTMVDQVCREVRRRPEAFGGLQLVLAGDFFQLPPVSKMSESRPAAFAYHSPAWEQARVLTCYLTEQYRQDDASFLDMLASIRRNSFSRDQRQAISKRKVDPGSAPEDAPKLFSHNVDVDRINEAKLARLAGKSRCYVMEEHGPAVLTAALKKGCLSPPRLCLKKGASVMFTKNNPSAGFVNGTLGTVESFSGAGQRPLIRTRQGRLVEAGPMTWNMEESGRVKASISQLPLRLAWAITVHKSQGMSMDEAVVDLSQVFEFGQGYVALSRVRRLQGLFLLGCREQAWRVHPDALEADGHFREVSRQAQHYFSRLGRRELARMHRNFVMACGGVVSSRAGSGDGRKYLAAAKKQSPRAYRRWDRKQDEELRRLYAKKVPVDQLAATLGRRRGAIASRLRKLGL